MIRSLFFFVCIMFGASGGLWLSSGGGPLANLSNILAPLYKAPAAAKIGTPTTEDPPITANTDPSASHNSYTTNRSPVVLSYHDGITKVAPSVVSLYAKADSDIQATSQGSGVIVDANGIILTNFHLVEGFSLITVVLSDGRSYSGELIGSDRETDLAVVKIAAVNLPFMRLDEAAPLRVGDVVLAIGNPFGVGQTVTQGIVSATRRRVAGGTVWQNFIQIDAAINPGNSGGALINPQGQLVGVNTAVFRGDSGAIGIGFSIPADLLAQVVPQIIENGSVARGWLGIGVDDINMFPVLRRLEMQGAVITAVLEGSPASNGGLRAMDIVVRLGEQPIVNATQLLLQVSALPPGATVKLSIIRSQPNALTDSTQIIEFEALDLKMRLGLRPQLNSAG